MIRLSKNITGISESEIDAPKPCLNSRHGQMKMAMPTIDSNASNKMALPQLGKLKIPHRENTVRLVANFGCHKETRRTNILHLVFCFFKVATFVYAQRFI